MDGNSISSGGKCPIMHGTATNAASRGRSNTDWWPNRLNLKILAQHSNLSDPMDSGFDYAAEFSKLDLETVKADLTRVDDRQSRLVACRLWPLWSILYSYGLAQCRHISYSRRPRGRWIWPTTLCTSK